MTAPAVLHLLITTLLGAARAAALPEPVDLDGDNKPESFSRAQETAIKIGAASVECGMEPGDCLVSVVDIKPGDKRKELVLCWQGPRDDRQCELQVYAAGKLTEMPIKIKGEAWWPSAIEVPGTGFIYVDSVSRIYTRRDKFTLSADGKALTHVPQPFLNVGTTLHIERSFAITAQPAGGAVVANARPDTDIVLLLESGELPDHFLVRLSSGLVGWATLEALLGASDGLKAAFSAG